MKIKKEKLRKLKRILSLEIQMRGTSTETRIFFSNKNDKILK
jgi:hypothetical protein